MASRRRPRSASHALLEYRFDLDQGTAAKLIADATLAEGEAVDLYHFTSVIMRSVNEEGRLRIIEMMWELVFADGHVTEFEDNVWRAADLLGISARDRLNLSIESPTDGWRPTRRYSCVFVIFFFRFFPAKLETTT
jgi:uncharacterized tellurite resistance protein B-like protein